MCAEWTESLHPRDELGRWAFKGGSGGWLIDKDDRAEISRFTGIPKQARIVEDREIRAISDYRIFGSVKLNRDLRAGQSSKQRGMVEALDSIIAKNPLSVDVTLYRYFPAGGKLDTQIVDLKPGDTITDKGFMSTTLLSREQWRSGKSQFKQIKILAEAGSRAAYLGDASFAGEQEVLLGRNSRLEYVGEDDDGSRIFRLQQDSKAESQSLNLRSKGNATAKLQEYSSAGEKALLTDVTGFESEGIIGFLTPDGRTYNTQDEHARVAKEAGTSLDALLEEGTFRVYANGSDTLGIEAHVPPTKQQIAELSKMARAGNYDRFSIDKGGQDYEAFVGHVTPAAVRDTVEKAFATLHLTSSFKTETDQVKQPALHDYDPGQNEFLRVANDTKMSMDVYKDGHFWKQKGPQQQIEQQASEAVVTLGGTTREMLALVSVSDEDSARPHRVAFQAGSSDSVSPSYDVYAMMSQDRAERYKAIHNHPLPYTLSNGDIGWLNNMLQVKTMREDDLDGGWSEASIPGREKGEYVKWSDLGSQLFDYNDAVAAESYHAEGNPPLKRVRNTLISDPKDRKTIRMVDRDLEHGPLFLRQHAEMVGLHNAGIISYKYQLSPWQQKIMDRFKPEFDETVEIATRHAKKLKDFIGKPETWVVSKNEFYPK